MRWLTRCLIDGVVHEVVDGVVDEVVDEVFN